VEEEAPVSNLKKLLIGIASYSGAPDYEVAACMQRDIRLLVEENVYFVDHDLLGGCLDTPRVRNVIFEKAYSEGYDELVFIDDDISWTEPGLIGKLLKYQDVEVVGYSYRKRSEEDRSWTIIPLKRGVRPELPPPGGLLQVLAAPTGFMRITRSAMERMVKKFGDRWYFEHMSPRGKVWSMFEFSIFDRQRVTDDVHFCYLFNHIGGKIWVNPDPVLSHHGRKKYTASLRAYHEGCVAGTEKDQWM
jgi:hypothetical protein